MLRLANTPPPPPRKSFSAVQASPTSRPGETVTHEARSAKEGAEKLQRQFHPSPPTVPMSNKREDAPSKGVGEGVGAGEGDSASCSNMPRFLLSLDLAITIWALRASCSRDFILPQGERAVRGLVGPNPNPNPWAPRWSRALWPLPPQALTLLLATWPASPLPELGARLGRAPSPGWPAALGSAPAGVPDAAVRLWLSGLAPPAPPLWRRQDSSCQREVAKAQLRRRPSSAPSPPLTHPQETEAARGASSPQRSLLLLLLLFKSRWVCFQKLGKAQRKAGHRQGPPRGLL